MNDQLSGCEDRSCSICASYECDELRRERDGLLAWKRDLQGALGDMEIDLGDAHESIRNHCELIAFLVSVDMQRRFEKQGIPFDPKLDFHSPTEEVKRARDRLAEALAKRVGTIKECEQLRRERDEARYNARILAHAYEHDSRPPPKVVDDSLAYPVDSRVIVEGGP